MPEANHRHIFYNNIINDKDSFVWFSFVLSKKENRISSVFIKLSLSLLRLISLVSFVSFSIYSFRCLQTGDRSLILAILLSISGFVFSELLAKKLCAKESLKFIDKYYPNLDLKKDTLYMICEKITHELKAFSFIEMINIREKVFLAATIIAVILSISLSQGIMLKERVFFIIFFSLACNKIIEYLSLLLCFAWPRKNSN